MNTLLLRRVVPAALLACATASTLSAQAADSINGTLLPVRVDTFTASFQGSVVGRGIMARSRISNDRLLQVYEWRGAGGDVIVDSLVSELQSLRPIREVRVLGDTVIEAAFQRDSVTVITNGRDPHRHAFPGTQNVYSSASLEALVAAAPLAEGYRQNLTLYYAPPSGHGFQSTLIRVQGAEAVRAGAGGTRDAWIVSASTPDGETTFWIDKVTRSALKYDTREGPATIEFRRQSD